MKWFLSAKSCRLDVVSQNLPQHSFCSGCFIFRPLSSCKCATSTLWVSGRGRPGGTFHFYYSFGMKLHPRALGADRGNFTEDASVRKPTKMGCRWRCSAGKNCSSGEERMSWNITVTDGGRSHENFPSSWWNTCRSSAAAEQDAGCNYAVRVNITAIIWLWLSSLCRRFCQRTDVLLTFPFSASVHHPPQWDASRNQRTSLGSPSVPGIIILVIIQIWQLFHSSSI